MTAGEPRLHVAVDARALHASGIGRYTRELLSAWLRDPPFARLTLLGDVPALRAFVADEAGAMPVDVVPHRGGVYSPVAQWSWLNGARAAAARADATFFPHWDGPAAGRPRASVVTVHDLTPFRLPNTFGAARRVAGRVLLRRVLTRATRVVCVSRAAAGEVAEAFPALAAPVRVVPNGVSARFAGPPPDVALPDAALPGGPYLLWVGNLKPHKNPAGALRVLAAARAAGWPALRMVVVGRAFPELQLAALAAEYGVADAVVAAGEVDDATLHALYARCVALVFPSRAEGFGLPVLEAMLAGAPVVASSVPALAEVVDGAAPLFAPDDITGMTDAVLALLRDPSERARRVARGREQAARFSWANAARDTAAVIAAAARDVATRGRTPGRDADPGVARATDHVLTAGS